MDPIARFAQLQRDGRVASWTLPYGPMLTRRGRVVGRYAWLDCAPPDPSAMQRLLAALPFERLAPVSDVFRADEWSLAFEHGKRISGFRLNQDFGDANEPSGHIPCRDLD